MNSKLSHILWPLVGLAVAALCVFLLVRELWSLSWPTCGRACAMSARCTGWALSAARFSPTRRLPGMTGSPSSTSIATCPGRSSRWASFVSYALSHNIGAAVLSGAVVRYRIYSTKGLSVGEIGVLVAFCAFTFGLGVTILGGILLVIHPELAQRFIDLPEPFARLAGLGMLLAVCLYVAGSLMHLKPAKIWGFSVFYPRPEIVVRQLIIGPMELIGAAAIIYFCLPESHNPGFVIVLEFSSPRSRCDFLACSGRVGVLELLFIKGLPDIPQPQVVAALIVFRLFYLVLPLAISLVAVVFFERHQMMLRRKAEGQTVSVESISIPKPSSPT